MVASAPESGRECVADQLSEAWKRQGRPGMRFASPAGGLSAAPGGGHTHPRPGILLADAPVARPGGVPGRLRLDGVPLATPSSPASTGRITPALSAWADVRMWCTDATAARAYQVRHATSADGLTWSAPFLVTAGGWAAGPDRRRRRRHRCLSQLPDGYGDGATWPSSNIASVRRRQPTDCPGPAMLSSERTRAPGYSGPTTCRPAYQWRYGPTVPAPYCTTRPDTPR